MGRYAGEIHISGRMDAEPVQQVDNVGGKAHAHAHVAEGVFENQVPADDPGHQFAQRGVGVGVGRAGDGNHRRQLGVAEAGEGADNGHQHQRERQRRAGAGPARHGRVQDEVVEQRRVLDGRRVEVLPRHGRADDREDARADDRADAQRGQRPRPQRLLQRVLGLFRIADQLVDRLAGKQLAGQRGLLKAAFSFSS